MRELYILGATIIALAYITIPFTYRLIKDQILNPKVPKNRKTGYIPSCYHRHSK